MAAKESTMLELGTDAPEFALLEPATDKIISSSDFADKPLLVAFICNHCPFVVLIRDALAQLANEYQEKGIAVVAINANDATNYPDDSPEKMVAEVHKVGYNFPYLYDESQEVAKAYQAACTPDFFLFDKHHHLFYRGQFDSARPGNGVTATGEDLRNAMDALLKGLYPPNDQKASIGCSIKWKADNSPEYA